jgi:hypothetical protein
MSVFDGYAADLQELGPLGSPEWLVSWAKLRRAAVVSLCPEYVTGMEFVRWLENLSEDDLADRAVEISQLWWDSEAMLLEAGRSRGRYQSNSYPSPMPGDYMQEQETLIPDSESEAK